jgi:hypothetical protein
VFDLWACWYPSHYDDTAIVPYIKEDEKPYMQFALPKTPGELNFMLTTIVKAYWNYKGSTGYQHINDIIGALEGAKLEFYRRVAAPYEDTKITENGDVY